MEEHQLTGTLGEITTLGFSGGRECRAGVDGPLILAPLLGLPPIKLVGWNVFEDVVCCALALAGGPGMGAPGCICIGGSLLGNGLFRDSTRLDVDEVGVADGE